MNSLISATRTQIASRWTVVLFALGVLAIGTIPGRLTFALDPNAPTRIGLEAVPIPAAVFIGVWLIAYPCMGVATWLVWRTRSEQDISVPIAVFIAALLQTLSFWLTNSIRMTAVIDATGLLFAYTVAWVYFRYQKTAVWWLVPWLVWMPITLSIKLWAVFSGVH